jgi:ankyrin repeat protein
MKRYLHDSEHVVQGQEWKRPREAVEPMSLQQCMDSFIPVLRDHQGYLLEASMEHLRQCSDYTPEDRECILVNVFRSALTCTSVDALQYVIRVMRELNLNIPSCTEVVNSNDPDMALCVFGNNQGAPLACVNDIDVFGRSALHVAVMNTNIPMVLCLLRECDADINLLNDQNQTPLFLATQARGFRMVQCLLDEGASMSKHALSVGSSTTSSLLYAVEQQFTGVVGLMLRAEMLPNLTERNHLDETPLIIATRQNNTAMVQLILASCHVATAGIRSCDSKQRLCTPLVHAVHHSNIPVIQSLLAAQASPNSGSRREHSALLTAAFRSDIVVMEMLLKCSGVLLDEVCTFYDDNQSHVVVTFDRLSSTGDPALIQASACIRTTEAAIIHGSGTACRSSPVAYVDAHEETINVGGISEHPVIWVHRCTALQLACARGDTAMVKCLLEGGQDTAAAMVSLNTNQGNTTLLYAVSGGHLDIVQYLVENYNNKSLMNSTGSGRCLLICAVCMDHLAIIEYLMTVIEQRVQRSRLRSELLICKEAIRMHNHRCLEWVLEQSAFVYATTFLLYEHMALAVRTGADMYVDLRELEWLNSTYPMIHKSLMCEKSYAPTVKVLMHILPPVQCNMAQCSPGCDQLVTRVTQHFETYRHTVRSFFDRRMPVAVIGVIQQYTDSVADSIELVG